MQQKLSLNYYTGILHLLEKELKKKPFNILNKGIISLCVKTQVKGQKCEFRQKFCIQ